MKTLAKHLAHAALIVTIAVPPGLALADSGELVYRKKCSACHGKEGKGDTGMGQKLKAKDLSDPALQAELKDEQIEGFVVDGIPDKKMPSQKDKLTPDEVKAVVQFVRTLKRK